MLKSIAPSALLLSGALTVMPTAASAVTYGLCAPDDNFFASSCVGTLASSAMLVRNDLHGFFLGRWPTFTEDSVLSGVGDTRLRGDGAPDWNRISEAWATQGVGLSTQLSYPAPAGRDPPLAEATAKALLSSASIGVSTRNHGTGHAPTNGYATQATSYARLAGQLTTGVVNGQYAYAIDFGRTATFGIDVPPDASWSSHSGVFLSQPVPEPSSSALLAVGVTLLGSVHGLRRRSAPVAGADALIGQ